jgi:TatD DNase family protein
MIVDSHCHVYPQTYGSVEEAAAAVARAHAAGVGHLVVIGSGYGVESARAAFDTAERHPDVSVTVGIHPHDASHWDAVKGEIEALARLPRVVALGEMGLDFYYEHSPRDVQRRVLAEQAEMALRLGLPVVVHDRDAGFETFDILRDAGAFGGRGVLWHCFTGDVAMMEKIVDSGGLVSIPGIVTFKNAAAMREVATVVPLDRILVETDSPFLAPIPHRGRKNEPAFVVHVVEAVAKLRGISVEELSSATTENAIRFFGLPISIT